MDFKAKLIEIEPGYNVVVVNEETAMALGFDVSDRVLVRADGRSAVAIVDHTKTFVKNHELGVFQDLAKALSIGEAMTVSVEPAPQPASLDYIRKKLDGGVLSEEEVRTIIADVMSQKLSSAELASFVSAVYTKGFSTDETTALTQAIIDSGEVIIPPFQPVASEHSIGGVAGGRSSMLLVPIIASLGICVPKTASRAISSASATADVMEVLAPVSFNSKQILEILRRAGACIVWGGAVNIASADDKFIRIRRPLRLDPQPLLVASILAKKKAEGAQFVVFDIPVGRGVKIPDAEKGRELARTFEVFATKLGIRAVSTISDGSEPLMHSLGPALEARGVLELLASRGKKGEQTLLEKACIASGALLHAIRGITREEGYRLARQQVENGQAYEKMRQIIEAQGGDPDLKPEQIELGSHRESVFCEGQGRIAHIDNQAVSRVLRALGAPKDKRAGLAIKVSKGQQAGQGGELFELYASTPELLANGLEAVKKVSLIELERIILEVV